MSKLKIMDLYDESSSNQVDGFVNRLNSSLRVVTEYDKVDCNYEWLSKMEETIIYLDNILRNPNRFIINEEEVIKIELARRVGVESIKHLSRNTNLIQEFDTKTGDVKPSKILNINKEESYDTYENRFIYSLIQNMKIYIDRKKKNSILESSYKNNKKFEYQASSLIGNEKVNVSLSMDSKQMENSSENKKDDNISERLAKLELQISDLTNSEVYRSIERKHVSLVTSPIKKTNVILKNVNFQYALALWNYLQSHIDDDVSREKKNTDYFDDGKFKSYLDESFLLDYLVIDSLDNERKGEEKSVDTGAISERLIGNMIEKLVDLTPNISEEQLKDIVAKQYTVIKYRDVATDREIRRIFKKHIEKYLEQWNDLKI